MSDRMDELLLSLGREQNDNIDFDKMYAALIKKQEERKRAARRAKYLRYGAMAASAVLLIGLGSVMLSSGAAEPETIAMTEDSAAGGEVYNGLAYDPEAETASRAKMAAPKEAAEYETAEIGTCEDAEQRLAAAGISAEAYDGPNIPEAGYAAISGDEAIWNAGSGVYKMTLAGDIPSQLRALCE